MVNKNTIVEIQHPPQAPSPQIEIKDVDYQLEQNQVQIEHQNILFEIKITQNRQNLQNDHLFIPIIPNEKTLKQKLSKSFLVLGIIINCLMIIVGISYAIQFSYINGKVKKYKTRHQQTKNQNITFTKENQIIQQIQNLNYSNQLTFYHVDQIITLVFHSLLTIIAAFLPEKLKKSLFQSLNGKFLSFLEVISALISILNIINQGLIVLKCQDLLSLLQDIVKEYREVAQYLDKPINFLIDDNNFRGGVGQCANLIYSAFQEKNENGNVQGQLHDQIIGSLMAICNFYKKRDRVFIIWVSMIVVELIASLFLLLHFKLYCQNLLAIQNFQIQQKFAQQQRPFEAHYEKNNKPTIILQAPKSPKTELQQDDGPNQARIRGEEYQDQVQSDRSTSMMMMNSNSQHQRQRIDQYFGEISIIQEPSEVAGDHLSSVSHNQEQITTIKRTKRKKVVQRLDAVKLAKNSFIAQITQNFYQKQRIMAPQIIKKDSQLQEI